MLPLLTFTSDGEKHHIQEIISNLADSFDLDEPDRSTLLPSGKEPVFNNRVRWAGFHLNKAQLLSKPQRGYLETTARGFSVLKEGPPKIDLKFLKQYPEYVAFAEASGKTTATSSTGVVEETGAHSEAPTETQTPEEAIGSAYETVRNTLAAELLEQIKNCSPAFFEQLVVDLLVKMGYGGTRADAGEVIGKSGDGGIDGTIKEDRLGLDVLYLQAKRWENTVGRPDIQQFAGALQGQKARKGIFITTSDFSKAAADYARNIESSIVLVNGKMLAELMMDHNVGVTLETSYEVKRIDSDYFDEI